MTEEEYNDLKAKVDKAKADSERAQGALEELKARLKREFDVKSFDEAKTLLKNMEKKATKLESELDEMVKEYQEQWHGEEE